MRYRTLPRTDVTVSEVGFGVWTLARGPEGAGDRREAVELLRTARDLGITLFVADDDDGRGETLLAEAFAGSRDGLVYATAIGGERRRAGGREDRPHGWSPELVRRACEESLRRLRTDRIDVCLLRRPDREAIDSDALFGTLEDLVSEGALRSYGIALGARGGGREEAARAMRNRGVATVQAVHSILEQQPVRDLVAEARQDDVGFLVRSPHHSGMLEGKYTPETRFPSQDERARRPSSWLTEGLQKIATLAFLTEDRPYTLGQAALKWLLAEPLVMSALPSAFGREQLAEFAAAPDLPDLTDEDLRRVDALYAAGFGLAPTAP